MTRKKPTPRRDDFGLSEKLRSLAADFGLSEAKIADEVGTSQGSINRIKHGRQPCRYEVGKRIEALHARMQALAKAERCA